MRNLLYIIALSIGLWSCGGDEPTHVNTVPTTPTLVSPANNSLCIDDNVVNFQWNTSTDSEGDAITYQIQVAKDNLFSQIAHTLTSTTTSQSISLEKGIAYYWRVKATDNKSASSNYSATFSFYTEGEGIINHLPFSPVLVSPALDEVVNGTTPTIALQWTAIDVDTNDTLTYDVYFGIANPPTIVTSENQSASTLNQSISPSTTYYWKVTVKDSQGGQTIGQVWSFTTD